MARKVQVVDLLSFQLVGDVQISPVGDRVAFTVSRTDKEKNEYQSTIYMGTSGQEPYRFTGGDHDASPRFSPDGTKLAFISKRSGQPQIWVMDLMGGEARQLTRIQGGVEEMTWAPDSSRIAFTALLKGDGIQPEVKEEKEEDLFKKHTKRVKVITELFHKLDGVGYFGERRPSLCITGLAEDAKPVQLTTPPYMVDSVNWAPDGQTLVFTSRMGPDYDLEPFQRSVYAIAAGGGDARLLTPPDLDCGGARVSPDGSTVVLIANHPADQGYGNGDLCLVPLAGGALKRIAAQWDRPFFNEGISDMPAPGAFAQFTWTPDGASIYTLSSLDGTTQLVRVDVASGEVKPVTSGDRLVYGFTMDSRCRHAALGISSPLNPGDLYVLDLKEGSEERLSKFNDALLSELELIVPQRFYAHAPEGPRVDGWLMKPHGCQEGTKYPTVLFIHGGPMAMYAATFFFEFQLIAAAGYGVVYSNPRGSQGYGEQFCKAIMVEWGKYDYADLMAILDQAILENPWIDTERLGVTGGSYGGYMTNWIVSHSDRFKAAVSGRSVVDWRAMVGSGDGGADWIKRFGVAPWVDDTVYKQQSPITYVENVRTPILIEHQEGDLRCPIDQGMQWYNAIKFLGKAPVKFITYPEEFHGMSRDGKPWNRVHRLKEIAAWFDLYLQGH